MSETVHAGSATPIASVNVIVPDGVNALGGPLSQTSQEGSVA